MGITVLCGAMIWHDIVVSVYLSLTNGRIIVFNKDTTGELDDDGCVYVRDTDSGHSYREATKTMAVCM